MDASADVVPDVCQEALFPVASADSETENDNYWLDYEILLDRQFELEKEAVSWFGRVDLDVDATKLCRFGRADVVELVRHLFKHLQTQQRLFDVRVSR